MTTPARDSSPYTRAGKRRRCRHDVRVITVPEVRTRARRPVSVRRVLRNARGPRVKGREYTVRYLTRGNRYANRTAKRHDATTSFARPTTQTHIGRRRARPTLGDLARRPGARVNLGQTDPTLCCPRPGPRRESVNGKQWRRRPFPVPSEVYGIIDKVRDGGEQCLPPVFVAADA